MFSPNRCLKTLNPQLQNPKFYLSISHIHNPSSKNYSLANPAIQFVLNEAREFQSSKGPSNYTARETEETLSPHKQKASNVQVSHPWPEWAGLMEKLLKNGYFNGVGNPFVNNGELGNKEANYIRTACLNFARDQYPLIRYFSKEDILAIVKLGCPSTDRKVVNSGKRLRAHVGIEEGNVCSSCILRGDCDRAYVKARDDEGGRTVDVMRLLVVYSLDPVMGSVENKPCINRRLKESVRTLLKEMVENSVEVQDLEPPKDTASKLKLSLEKDNVDTEGNRMNVPMKQGDWICPKCNFLNFARNLKCLRCDTISEERLKRLAEEQENLPLKKGDWICDKCKFMNFARNTRCLQCRENPPKRELNPGEWQCDSCNYINFRRNMVCLKCDHKRPIASNAANIQSQMRNDNLQDHLMHHPRFAREQQTTQECYNDSLRFVESENDKQGAMGFVDFPISGGKSNLSCNEHRRELWKMEMENKNRTATRKTTGHEPGKIEFLATGDEEDDDEMAEWFDGRKR